MKKFKRLLSALMAGVMAVSMLGTVAFADETTDPGYQETSPYVLSFDGKDIPESYRAFVSDLLYTAPHNMSFYVTSNGTSKLLTNEANPSVFNLINTSKITNEKATSPYAAIPAYCVDMATGTVAHTNYQRLNLEDSTHFDTNTAGKLRAIILNGFPYNSLEDLRKTTGLDTLTGAEAITSMQYAIWMNANKDTDFNPAYKYPVLLDQEKSSAYSFTVSEDSAVYPYYVDAYEDKVLLPDEPVNWLEAASADTASNIEDFADYLMGLTPVKSQQTVISNATLKNLTVDYQQAEGAATYTALVSVDVEADIGSKDELVLSAILGDSIQNIALTDSGTYSFTFADCTSRSDVSVEINGYQYGGDAYLFEPIGGRDASQDMIGYDDSRLPVHAEASTSPARKLHLYKYTPTSSKDVAGDGTVTQVTNRTPLANIKFAIYEVCSLEDYLSGKVSLSASPTEDEVKQYQVDDNHVGTIVTNQNGYASYDFGHGKNDGIYLVVELPNNAVTAPAAPFYLSVPMTNPTGDGWLYDIYVYPKNDVEDGPGVDKDVTSIDQEEDSADVDELITYIIRGEIPADMADSIKYEISDTLDARLDYEGNVSVKLFAGKTENEAPVTVELPLVKDQHYTVTESDIGTAGGSFTMALTKDGKAYVMSTLASYDPVIAEPEIRVYFNASINTSAQMGVEIPNKATLDYTNSVNFDYAAETEEVKVYTGAANLLKVDGNTKSEVEGVISYSKPLSGATFQVYRAATNADTETVSVDGIDVPVVLVKFFNNAEMTGEKVDSVISGEDGKVAIYGLAYGTYYLVETAAPSGYNLLPAPAELIINETSHTDVAVRTIENYGGFELPETGGIGTTVYTLMGSMTMAASGMYIFLKKRER